MLFVVSLCPKICQRNVTTDGIKEESLAGGQVSNDIININMISVGH